jgi:putative membrane protein
MNVPTEFEGDKGTRLAYERTVLADERTQLAHERTLMAWVRTAVSLISFGFTIYKFFDFAQSSNPTAPQRLIGPRGYALMMIGIGLGSLIFAWVQYKRYIVHLKKQETIPRSAVGPVAAMVSLMGIFTLVVVIFHQ